MRVRLALAALYVAINAPFVAKYAMRAGVPGGVAVAGYVLGVAVAWRAAGALAPRLAALRPGRRLTLFVTVVLALALLAIMKQFDPVAIRVTRYAALDDWIALFLSGRFPYGASSSPSSFPFMFVWAMPWRALGDLGYLQIASFLAFGALCAAAAGAAQTRAIGTVIALAGAPIFLYEVVTRSELFSNMMVVLLVLVALERAHRMRALVPLAVAAGLALSTRGVVALAAAVALPHRFRGDLVKGLAFALIGSLTFVATLIPFALWDPRQFHEHGPFAIQASYASRWLLALAFAIALALGWRARGARDLYVGILVAMLIPVAAMFLYSAWTEGWNAVLLGDRFDISYFAFAHTFLIYAAARFGWSADTDTAHASGAGRGTSGNP